MSRLETTFEGERIESKFIGEEFTFRYGIYKVTEVVVNHKYDKFYNNKKDWQHTSYNVELTCENWPDLVISCNQLNRLLNNETTLDRMFSTVRGGTKNPMNGLREIKNKYLELQKSELIINTLIESWAN